MKKDRVNIVALSKEINHVLSDQQEVLQVCSGGNYRPFLILVRLKYQSKWYMFALPLRSNIGNAHKETYFVLPRRKTTKKGRKHGLHYTKMIPVHSRYLIKYHMNDLVYDRYLISYIGNQLESIIKGAQLYLDEYESRKRYNYSVDINAIIDKFDL